MVISGNVPLVLGKAQFAWNDNLHSDECDCARPDIEFVWTKTMLSSATTVHQPPLYQQPLTSEHTLLFNPQHDSGTAVLNQPALAIWNKFQAPRFISSLHTVDAYDITSVARQMVQLGLLQPVDARPQSSQQGRPHTLSVWLHVTNECNLRCAYCYISKTAESMSEETGMAAIDAVIRSAQRAGFRQIKLKFAGGEATLNLKLIFSLHQYAQIRTEQVGLGLESVILSNGVALAPRTIAELKARDIRLSISLDGVGTAHDAQRRFVNGTGSFAWVDRSLERILAQGMTPFVSVTVTDRNAGSLPETVQYLLEHDLPFNLNFYRENTCAVSFADLALREDRLIAGLHSAFDVLEAELPDRSLLGSLVDRAQFDSPHERPCGVGQSYMVIDHRGNVAKCHMEIENPVTDIFASDPLNVLRTDTIHLQNIPVTEKDGCRECEWRYWCAGGCPLLTYRAMGRYDLRSPYCQVYKAVYPRLLRLEGLRLLKLHRKSIALSV